MQFADWIDRQNGVKGPSGDKTIVYTQDRATWREQNPGPLTHTGNPFDLALAGDGYFTVGSKSGPRLTRDGRFGLMPDGTLADGLGEPVLNTSGQPIQISPTDVNVTIAADGSVSSDNGQLGKIGVVVPNDQNQMRAEGATHFISDATTTQATTPGIVQGAIEDSNVQPVMETTRMMDDVRQFQFMTQLVQAESDRQQSAIDKLLPTQGS